MRQVFVLRYTGPNCVEAFEDYNEAVDTGVDFITQIGEASNWSEDEINDEVSYFRQFKVSEVVEFYCCDIKEACQ